MLQSSPETSLASDQDYLACRDAIRSGSRSFYTASWLLPDSVRRPAYGLYAFCRLSDDAVDLDGGSLDALARLRARLQRCYERRPLNHFADRAFADMIHAFHVPREVPEALLDGLGWDCEERIYATIEEVHAYSARVASTVGVMMTLLMGVRDPTALARACDLGVAMQISNICRDVGEDARMGRLYLPRDWCFEEGVDPQAFLADPRPSPALARVVARMLAEADRLYKRSEEGVARLPWACRPAILAAAAIYGEIGRQVERNGLDNVTQRARVSGKRKLALLAECALRATRLAPGEPEPALQATAFLVEAVARCRVPYVERYSVREHALRVLDIFERLERADQARRLA